MARAKGIQLVCVAGKALQRGDNISDNAEVTGAGKIKGLAPALLGCLEMQAAGRLHLVLVAASQLRGVDQHGLAHGHIVRVGHG
jgi:hypothetical protein